MSENIPVFAANEQFRTRAEEIAARLGSFSSAGTPAGEHLFLDENGLWFVNAEGLRLRGDFEKLAPRILPRSIGGELPVRACRGRGASEGLKLVDATAGLGEDSFLLAAAGYDVTLIEYNPVVCELLRDALERGAVSPGVGYVVSRMKLICGNSLDILPSLDYAPDVIYLDPMFPERTKSSAVKKKFQLIHLVEKPCEDGELLLSAAMSARPRKIVVKRPAKGPYLGGIKPSYSVSGNSVRYDCIVPSR